MDEVENNKLLAEFMEWRSDFSWLENNEYETPHTQEKWVETGLDCGWEHVSIFTPAEMLFNKSWDWLMPVIDKIESFGYKFDINKGYSYLEHETESKFLDEATGKNKLEASYRLVVKFIKWYNNN